MSGPRGRPIGSLEASLRCRLYRLARREQASRQRGRSSRCGEHRRPERRLWGREHAPPRARSVHRALVLLVITVFIKITNEVDTRKKPAKRQSQKCGRHLGGLNATLARAHGQQKTLRVRPPPLLGTAPQTLLRWPKGVAGTESTSPLSLSYRRNDPEPHWAPQRAWQGGLPTAGDAAEERVNVCCYATRTAAQSGQAPPGLHPGFPSTAYWQGRAARGHRQSRPPTRAWREECERAPHESVQRVPRGARGDSNRRRSVRRAPPPPQPRNGTADTWLRACRVRSPRPNLLSGGMECTREDSATLVRWN